MKRITLILTGLLAAQLVIALALTFSGNDNAAFQAQEPLLAFDPKAVDQIAIDESGSNSTTLKKQDGKWVVPALADFPADGQKVKTLLDKLAGLKKGWAVATTRDASERYKLTDKSHERRIALMSGGKPVGIVLIGTSPSYRQVHARVDGSDTLYNVGFATYDAGTRGEEWIDREVLAIPQDKIAGVAVGDVTLERKDGKFTVAGLADHEQVVDSELNAFVRAVSNPTFDSIQGKGKDEAAKLDAPDVQITVKRSDGPDITCKYKKQTDGSWLFGSSANDYVFRVAEANIQAITQVKRNKLVEEKKKPEASQTPQPNGGSGG